MISSTIWRLPRKVWRHQRCNQKLLIKEGDNTMVKRTRGSVGWACVAHFSFCFEET